MKKVLFYLIPLACLLCLSAFKTPADPFDELLKKLDIYTKKFPSEKVYLHLDKPYYATADDLWFKAYVIDTKTEKLTSLSKVLYVELINENNTIIKQLCLPMEAGVSWGDFKLPDTLKEGNYRVRSYTQLMRNAGQQFFFDKTIKIGSSWVNKVFTEVKNEFISDKTTEKVNSSIKFTDKSGKPYIGNEVNFEIFLQDKKVSSGNVSTNNTGSITIPIVNTQPGLYKTGKIVATITLPNKSKVVKTFPIKATSANVDVQFFPEGGYLIEGLPNKLAFKAVNTNGLGEDISGKIIDNNGIEVVDFKTAYLGMGALQFIPEAGKTYTALVKFANGNEQKFALPIIQKSGYAVLVNNSDSLKTTVKVYISPDLIGKGNVQLLAQRNGNIYFSTTINTSKQTSLLSIPKKDFPSGLVQLNLFNAANVPIWERFIFINNTADKIDFDVENLNKTYNKRANTSFNLALKDNIGLAPKGTFSVSVTNANAVAPDLENESNILTSLLLSSDVVGYIEKPNHYFLKDNIETRQELDNLLLTQAWRKIDWKKINNPEVEPTFGIQKGLIISGTITNLSDKPIAGSKITLFSNSNGIYSSDTLSNAKGKFSFGPMVFNDSTKFVLRAVNAKGKEFTKIILDQIPGELVAINKNSAEIDLNVNGSLKGYLNSSDTYFDELGKQGLKEKTINLNTVEITQTVKPSIPNSVNFNGPGEADFVLGPKEIGNNRSLQRLLMAIVPGLTFPPELKGLPGIRGFSTTLNQPIAMDVLVDNIRVDTSSITYSQFRLDNMVPINDVESIEVMTSMKYTALYGGNKGGVIVITTKSNTLANSKTGVISFVSKGFNAFREFYSPKYDTTNDQKSDFRTTVYWNPNLLYNDKEKININYYNTDQAGTYRIVVEGIDTYGNLARFVHYYQVN